MNRFLFLCILVAGCTPPCNFTTLESTEEHYLENYAELKCLRDGDQVHLTYLDGREKSGVFVELERSTIFVQFDGKGAKAVDLRELKQITLKKAASASRDTRIVLFTLTAVVLLALITRTTSKD